MQLTAWLLVEVALLLSCLTQISVKKIGFSPPSGIESPLRPWALFFPRYLCLLPTNALKKRAFI
jgi:hypothetical protein